MTIFRKVWTSVFGDPTKHIEWLVNVGHDVNFLIQFVMSREEVTIVMSSFAHVIKVVLHPVLSRNLARVCPVVAMAVLEVLIIELKFKHST